MKTNTLEKTTDSSNSAILVNNGRPTAIIVIADNPTAAARQGAEELQMWLRKMSGAIVGPTRSPHPLTALRR